MTTLVLASRSPRRRAILETLGLGFEVSPSEVAERERPGEAPDDLARRLAREKALDVSAGSGDAWVLGADTVVVIDGAVLGKPADEAEGERMIARLSGRWHEVITGVALARGSVVEGEVAVTTRVRFASLEPGRVARYVASGEGRDKAGGYAVQGLASGFVEAIEGSYTNVVGLPAAQTLQLLERLGALPAWP